MHNSKIAVRYAKAAFSFASEQKMLDVFIYDIKVLKDFINDNSEFINFFNNPVVKTNTKVKAVDSFSKVYHNITIDVLKLIIANGRVKHLPAVIRQIEYLYKQQKGIKTVELKSVKPLDQDTKKKLTEYIKNEFSAKEIEIKEKTDKDLIGGFVLKMEDIQYDASVKTQLENIKRKFTEKLI